MTPLSFPSVSTDRRFPAPEKDHSLRQPRPVDGGQDLQQGRLDQERRIRMMGEPKRVVDAYMQDVTGERGGGVSRTKEEAAAATALEGGAARLLRPPR